MSYQLSWSDFPNSNFTFVTSWNDEFIIVTQSYGCNTILMSIVNLPQQLLIVDSVSSYLAIWPPREDNLISKYWAKRMDSSSRGLGVDTSCLNWVVVGIPKSDGTIDWASDEFIWDFWHVTNINNRVGMVLSQEHLREVTYSNSIQETLIGCRQ